MSNSSPPLKRECRRDSGPSRISTPSDPVLPTSSRSVPIYRGDATIVRPALPPVVPGFLHMPVPTPLPEPRNEAAFTAFASPDGALRFLDEAAFTVLHDYCQAHPPASVPELELIEEAFLRACRPLPEITRGLYLSLVQDRFKHSVLVEREMVPGGIIATQLTLYNVPALLHLPLFRPVTIRLPEPKLVRSRWAFTGVLMTLPLGYASALVRTYASFLANVRWVCPYALRSPNAPFWAIAVYSMPPAIGLHPYLAPARTYDPLSSIPALRVLALQATTVGGSVSHRLVRLHEFLAVLHSRSNLAADLHITCPHAGLVCQAIADVLDWA